jgi:hypothetical protein
MFMLEEGSFSDSLWRELNAVMSREFVTEISNQRIFFWMSKAS